MAIALNGTTGISGVDGSASAPALQGTDSNTGINFGSDTVNINTGGVTRATVDSSGNMGIGETSPIGKLHVSTADSGATAEVSADELVVEGSGHSGISVLSGTGSAGCLNFGDSGDNDIGRVIYHHATNHMQFNASGSEIMRLTIASTQIGTMSTSGGSLGFFFDLANGHGQQISTNDTGFRYQMRFYNPNGQVGYISTQNSATNYNTSGSDRTLKENFEDWNEDVLSLFKNINPQKFNFIADDEGAEKTKGFVAQDMVSSFPEAYTKGFEEDAKYMFNPSGMVVYLMKALKEAQAKIETLETKVAALEAG
jgi:hypothetical protein